MKKAFKQPRFLSLLFASILLFLGYQAQGQRAYYELVASSEVWENLDFSVEPELRYDGELHRSDNLVDLSLDYQFFKYFSAGFTYRRGKEWDENESVYDYERFAYDLKFTDDVGPLEYTLRFRYTTGYDPEDEITRKYFRYRLKLEPDKSIWGLKPFAGYELYQDAETNYHARNVLFAGVKYKWNKSINLNLEYKQVDKLHSKKDYDAITFSIGYEF